MQTVANCDERTLVNLARAIQNAAQGQQVSFWFDAGVTRRVEGGKTIDVPNGTVSIHIYVNGGAVDQTVPERAEKPEASS